MSNGEMIHQQQGGAIVPQFSMDDMWQMAQSVAKSGLFACNTPDQAMTLMLLCQAEGIHPIQAMRMYHIIHNRPAMKADAMQGKFQAAGGKVEWEERSDTRAAATFSHPSSPKPLPVEWTMERAKQADLLKNDMWRKYPRQMLTARVVSEGVRAVLPGVVVGIYTPEEVEDMPALPAPPPATTTMKPKRVESKPVKAAAKPAAEPDQAPDAADSDDALKYDENFVDAWRVVMGDRNASDAEADRILRAMLSKRGKTLSDLTVQNRRDLIEAAKAGKFDPVRATAAAPPPEDTTLPNPCALEQIKELAVQFGPGDIEAPTLLEQFDVWFKTDTSKPWHKLSRDEQERVFRGIKAGEPWVMAPAESNV